MTFPPLRRWWFPLPLVLGCALSCGDPMGPGGPDPEINRIQAGRDFTCALGDNRDVWCWGGNLQGQLGQGDVSARLAPTRVPIDEEFKSVSTDALAQHVCAVTTDGDAFCWGENDFGQLGIGTLESRPSPTLVVGGLAFASVGAGWRFSCGLTADGTAYCWGRGEWGQLGDGLATQSTSPVAVAGGVRFEQLDVGANNLVCGLSVEGFVYCWGLNFNGSLGTSTGERCTRFDGLMLDCATVPSRIDSDKTFTSVTAGNSFACAVTEMGEAYCWGVNDSGQLGAATTDTCDDGNTGTPISCSHVPLVVEGGISFKTLNAGIAHTCGFTTSGEGFCWGANDFGQRGDGLVGNVALEPVAVRGGIDFISMSAGSSHSCGESTSRLFYCWGANDLGQLGTGNREIGLVPVRVLGTP